MAYTQTQLNGLELFRSLTKDGATWHGDVMSRKWAECLYFTDGQEATIKRTLEGYEEGVDYKLLVGEVWIA